MQSTSALYRQIVAESGHWFETKLVVAGHEIPESEIINADREAQTMEDSRPSVGGALAKALRVVIRAPAYEIPRMGEISVYVRACTDELSSEWLAAGVFFIDTRSTDVAGNLSLSAYDAMLKAEQDYPDTEHDWPYLDRSVVAEIAAAIGVSVDARTTAVMTAGYRIDLPIGYTMREVLGQIAGAYGGNFVVTNDNKLLLVPLWGTDPNELVVGSYLAPNGSTDALVFGNEGWCILV